MTKYSIQEKKKDESHIHKVHCIDFLPNTVTYSSSNSGGPLIFNKKLTHHQLYGWIYSSAFFYSSLNI